MNTKKAKVLKRPVKELIFTRGNDLQYAWVTGFMRWQIYGMFEYGDSKVCFSDTPSGCGPVQMYHYNNQQFFEETGCREEWKEMFNKILKEQLLVGRKNFSRIPTSVMFVQGDPTDFFDETMRELGFEAIKEYRNIAHGKTSRDRQTLYYLDVTKLV